MKTGASQSEGIFPLLGLVMAAALIPLALLTSLIGQNTPVFLACFLAASAAYLAAVLALKSRRISLKLIWGVAIGLRLILLTTQPTLSTDVYRYIWDGQLINQGVNPYAEAVNAPSLDIYAIPAREMVNHDTMASPYLPAAQWYFALVTLLAPQSALAFQIAALILDLLTGWMVMQTLGVAAIPKKAVLIYLWNPLVIVEFAHGAHLDALMIFLLLTALYLWLMASICIAHRNWAINGSVLALALVTLTKGLPVLLVPFFLRRWGWRRLIAYTLLVGGACAIFASGAGWGVSDPLDGRGVFGALRIYLRYWNFNGGIYHWLEGSLQAATHGLWAQDQIRAVSSIFSGGMLVLVTLVAGAAVWRTEGQVWQNPLVGLRQHLRLALIPISAYLLLTHTVHPWYVTLAIPLLPFLYNAQGESALSNRFIWPGIFFSAAVPLSYLAYLDPASPSEVSLVRWIEYLPLYGWLLWAAWPLFKKINTTKKAFL